MPILEQPYYDRCNKLIAGLEKLKTEKFNMAGFSSKAIDIDSYKDFHNCGTTCCVVGLIPVVDMKFAIKYHLCIPTSGHNFSFFHMSQDYLNIGQESIEWEFLFSGDWNNDKEQAKKRIAFYRDNETYHPEFFQNERYNFKLVL